MNRDMEREKEKGMVVGDKNVVDTDVVDTDVEDTSGVKRKGNNC